MKRIEKMYQDYLKRVNLDESLMHPVQATETKRAFMAGIGSTLAFTVSDEFYELTEEDAMEEMHTLFKEVEEFFEDEVKKLKGNG